MQLTNPHARKIMTLAALTFLMVACKSTPMKSADVEDKSIAPPKMTEQKEAATTAADPNAIKPVEIDTSANAGSELNDPNSILSKRSIYFDYDSDAVKAEFQPVVDAHAKYLSKHADAKMILQGNTDERGTREYNLSLGQRRAVAVKKSLNLLGVQDAQIETVSYGEEKVDASCKDEACTAQNRRVDIVYEKE